MKALLAIVLVAGVAAGVFFIVRDRDHTTTTTIDVTTTPAATIPVETYFYLGAELVPSVTDVPKTKAVAAAATRALLAGPPSGYRTAVPATTRLLGVTISGGTAHVRLSAAFAGASRTAQAQLVYTLTQFPSVTGVEIDAGATRLTLSNGADEAIAAAASRNDYADLTSAAPIFVSAPLRDASVSSPVRIAGTASVSEATLTLEVLRAGKPVDTETLTASEGAPERGTFSDTLALPAGSYDLLFYEPSAVDGSRLHATTVPITVTGS
jgi:hypothetical protein